ncbi:hypothetical protein V6N12_011494 [Hibiscus sabdariffa]|uniref:Uncharacterized protein n=1 Tax=Hibiscus sabdariffa TaxID=183260 RepID=A0ABR2B3P3_9ROSI
MRAPMETKRLTPYQGRGIVYYRPLVIGEASSSKMNQPSLQFSNVVEKVPNSAVGISDKELDELAKIADELGVNSTLFVDSNVVLVGVADHGKDPIEPMMLTGIEPGSSSKDVGVVLAEQNNLSIGGIDTGSACIAIEKTPEQDMLIADLVPGSLAKVSKTVGSSYIMQGQGIEQGTVDAIKAGENCMPPCAKGR